MFSLVLVLSLCFIAFESSPIGDMGNRNKFMEVPGLHEGDIKLLPSDKTLLSTRINKWTDGVVYYTLSSSFTSTQSRVILAGMTLIENSVNILGVNYIKFLPRTYQSNYIRIISTTDGCYSYVGMIGGGQDLSLQAGGCTIIGIVAHELIHALGFFHEQSRNDRDEYVTVNYANIRPGLSSQFDKVTTNFDYQGLSYDILSIMHYGSFAFTSNGEATITAISGATLLEPYDKTALSPLDITALRAAYSVSSCYQGTTSTSITACDTQYKYCYSGFITTNGVKEESSGCIDSCTCGSKTGYFINSLSCCTTNNCNTASFTAVRTCVSHAVSSFNNIDTLFLLLALFLNVF